MAGRARHRELAWTLVAAAMVAALVPPAALAGSAGETRTAQDGWSARISGTPPEDFVPSAPTAGYGIDPDRHLVEHVPDVDRPLDPSTVRRAAVAAPRPAAAGGFGACGLVALPRETAEVQRGAPVPTGGRVVLPAVTGSGPDADVLLRAVDLLGRPVQGYGTGGTTMIELPPLVDPLPGASRVEVVAGPAGGVTLVASIEDADPDDDGDLLVVSVDADGQAGEPTTVDTGPHDALIDVTATTAGPLLATRQPLSGEDPTPAAAVVRLVDGAVDQAYGVDGRALLGVGFDGPLALESGESGDVYVRSRFDAQIMHVLADGGIDTDFGEGGVAMAPSGGPADDGAVGSDGGLWLATVSGSQARLDLLAPDGSAGPSRVLEQAVLSNGFATVSVDADGTALLSTVLPQDGELVEYLTVGTAPDGSPVDAVGQDGELRWFSDLSTIPTFSDADQVLASVAGPEGRVYVQTGDDLRRVLADGQLDGDCPVGEVGVVRVAGDDRFDTAAQLSASTFLEADTVVVATGVDFPDALAGGPAAAASQAPLLLVTGDRVPDPTAAELERLSPDRVLVLGGEAVVGTAVVEALGEYGEVTRLSGTNRYETAASVSEATFAPGVERVYVAVGTSFPDALAVGPAAGARGVPILLTSSGSIPGATLDELDRLQPAEVVLVGGTGAISAAVERDLRSRYGNVDRVAGADRYNTARQVMLFETQENPDAPPPVNQPRSPLAHLATGTSFPDALAAGPVAALDRAPLLLTRPDDLSEATRDALAIVAPQRVTVLGGTGALSGRVSDRLTAAELGHRFITYAAGEPVGWCQTLRWTFNPDGAPAGAEQLLLAAADRIEEASGLDLEYLGTTDEPLPQPGAGRSPLDRSGADAWAPVLVGWGLPANDVGVLGVASTIPVGPGWASGTIVFQQGAPLPVDFSAESWGIVALHEFGHLVGLDHVPSVHVMYPAVGLHDTTDLTAGDELGMRRASASSCEGWATRPSQFQP